MAFDTIYAEGQRRYVESLSSYARQFLGQMEKPDVDFIEGLSPAISIDQKSTSRNPRSTVGTITEIYDYLRVLFARVGHPHCYNCGRPIGRQTPEQIVDQVMELPEGTRFQVLAPIVRGRKGEYGKLLEELARKGYPRARIDGEVRELAEPIRLAKTYKHTIEVVVDRLVAKPDIRRRVADSIEQALDARRGHRLDRGRHARRATRRSRPSRRSSPAPTAACRSTSSRRGTSRSTRRTGRARRATAWARASRSTPSWSCPTPTSRSTRARSRRGRRRPLEYWYRVLEAVAETHGFSLDTPWKKLPKAIREVLLYGSDEDIHVRYKNRYGRQRAYWTTYEGVIPNIERRHEETDSDSARDRMEQFMREIPCRACKGARLRPETLAVTIGDLNISQMTDLAIRDALAFTDDDGAQRARGDDRRAAAEGDPRAARVPRRRRARLPDASAAPRARSRAARRSGSASRPRSAAAWSASCTSSTSRRSACTSATTAGCSTR